MVAFSGWDFMACLVCTRHCASALYIFCCLRNSRGEVFLCPFYGCGVWGQSSLSSVILDTR